MQFMRKLGRGGGGLGKKNKNNSNKTVGGFMLLSVYNYSFSVLLPAKVKGIESQCRSLKTKMVSIFRKFTAGHTYITDMRKR